MSHNDQIQAFASELDKLVDKFSAEFDLPYASAVGTLQIKIHLLCTQAATDPDQDTE